MRSGFTTRIWHCAGTDVLMALSSENGGTGEEAGSGQLKVDERAFGMYPISYL